MTPSAVYSHPKGAVLSSRTNQKGFVWFFHGNIAIYLHQFWRFVPTRLLGSHGYVGSRLREGTEWDTRCRIVERRNSDALCSLGHNVVSTLLESWRDQWYDNGQSLANHKQYWNHWHQSSLGGILRWALLEKSRKNTFSIQRCPGMPLLRWLRCVELNILTFYLSLVWAP